MPSIKEDALRSMRVKQLKVILAKRNVDSSTCLEKAELIQKVLETNGLPDAMEKKKKKKKKKNKKKRQVYDGLETEEMMQLGISLTIPASVRFAIDLQHLPAGTHHSLDKAVHTPVQFAGGPVITCKVTEPSGFPPVFTLVGHATVTDACIAKMKEVNQLGSSGVVWPDHRATLRCPRCTCEHTVGTGKPLVLSFQLLFSTNPQGNFGIRQLMRLFCPVCVESLLGDTSLEQLRACEGPSQTVASYVNQWSTQGRLQAFEQFMMKIAQGMLSRLTGGGVETVESAKVEQSAGKTAVAVFREALAVLTGQSRRQQVAKTPMDEFIRAQTDDALNVADKQLIQKNKELHERLNRESNSFTSFDTVRDASQRNVVQQDLTIASAGFVRSEVKSKREVWGKMEGKFTAWWRGLSSQERIQESMSTIISWIHMKAAVGQGYVVKLLPYPFGTQKDVRLCLLPELCVQLDVPEFLAARLGEDSRDYLAKDCAITARLQKLGSLACFSGKNRTDGYPDMNARIMDDVTKLLAGHTDNAPLSDVQLMLNGLHMTKEVDQITVEKLGATTPKEIDVNVYVTAVERARMLVEIASCFINGFRREVQGKSDVKRRVCRYCMVAQDQLPPGQRLRECARCKEESYCSVEHQKMDWQRHKLVCSKRSK